METHRFIALDIADEMAELVLDLLDSVPGKLAHVADHCGRAACSAPNNLAEGAGRCGRDRLYHFSVAYGSTKECRSSLGKLMHRGAVDRKGGLKALRLLDRLGAATWRLMQRPGPGPGAGAR